MFYALFNYVSCPAVLIALPSSAFVIHFSFISLFLMMFSDVCLYAIHLPQVIHSRQIAFCILVIALWIYVTVVGAFYYS